MGRFVLWVFLIALAILAAGAVWLMIAEPKVETKHVEKVVPNDKLGL